MATSDLSPRQMVWQRLRRNSIAMWSLAVLVTLLLLSLIANSVVYDHTPAADLQHPTLSLQPAGFTTEVLHQRQTMSKPVSAIDRLLIGYDKLYSEIPYKRIIDQNPAYITYEDHYGRRQVVPTANLISQPGEYQITFWLGTDRFGRSIWSRLLRGIRISFVVGGIAVFISLTIGILLGVLGGYFGGWIDMVVLFIINVTWSIPTLLMVFAIVLLLGRGLGPIFIAVGLTMWVDVARIVRGQTIGLRQAPFVIAEKSLGAGHFPIMLQHILPNIMGPILVIAAANFATAILIEAGLSYLGFGINPPSPSLGNILNEHYGYAVTGNITLALVPAVMIMILVLAFNLLGNGLRDAFDVKN